MRHRQALARGGTCAIVALMTTLHLITGSSSARAEAAMSFHAITLRDAGGHDQRGLMGVGRIGADTPGALADALRDGPPGQTPVLLLDSPGGSVLYAMQIGERLRASGATTIVQRRCYSACVYAFMGGRHRIVSARGQLGTHRMFVAPEGSSADMEDTMRRQTVDDSEMRRQLTAYTASMGVDPAVIAQAERTPSTTLHILTRAEMRRWRVTR